MSAYEAAKANLNKAVLCPDCDNTGCIPIQIAEGEWEPMQCEFCYCVEDSLFNRRTEFIQAADKEIARIPDYKETVRLLRQERRQLDAELARLREVLDKIANPVLALQEEAQEFGAKIDAVEAIRMTQNPSWYRTTARKALKSRDS